MTPKQLLSLGPFDGRKIFGDRPRGHRFKVREAPAGYITQDLKKGFAADAPLPSSRPNAGNLPFTLIAPTGPASW